MYPLTLLALEAIDLAEAIRRPPVDALLDAAIDAGTDLLARLTREAVKRLLARPMPHIAQGQRLFSDDELIELAEELGVIRLAAYLRSRSDLADRAATLRKRNGVAESRQNYAQEYTRLTEGLDSLIPTDALDFFRSLLPMLGTDSHILDWRRTAFTLAVATDQELLTKVQDAIAERIESGAVVSGPAAVNAILDAAGVSPRQSGYAEIVMRTNYLDAANQGYHVQLQQEIDTFPVWRYSNPHDSRSRPSHAARNGLYYPSTVTIDQVRGTDISEKANCRCVPIAQDKWTWARLKAEGARIADGYQDVAT